MDGFTKPHPAQVELTLLDRENNPAHRSGAMLYAIKYTGGAGGEL